MNALALSEADLVELRLLRDWLRKESLRQIYDGSRWIVTDDSRQAERWLAVIERILDTA